MTNHDLAVVQRSEVKSASILPFLRINKTVQGTANGSAAAVSGSASQGSGTLEASDDCNLVCALGASI